jgi:hypothetical protein
MTQISPETPQTFLAFILGNPALKFELKNLCVHIEIINFKAACLFW